MTPLLIVGTLLGLVVGISYFKVLTFSLLVATLGAHKEAKCYGT